LDWSHTGQGHNRHAGRCQIQARTDWDVFDIYLQRFVDRPHTFKSYRKEMERFVLWVRTVAQTSLCGVDVSHGQQYCEFLRAPDTTWLAPFAAPRGSLLWRPFVAPLSAKGIAYAQQVLGAWFQWLVDVQYLAGNPWKAVQKPLLVQAIHPIQIERALDAQTWHSLSAKGGVLDRLSDADTATAAAWLKIPPAPHLPPSPMPFVACRHLADGMHRPEGLRSRQRPAASAQCFETFLPLSLGCHWQTPQGTLCHRATARA
jgi:hypothetical protein